MGAAIALPAELVVDPEDRAAASKFSRDLLRDLPAKDAARVMRELIERHPAPFQTALAIQLVKLEGPDALRSYLEALPANPVVDFTATERALLSSAQIGSAELERFGAASTAAHALSTMLWDATRYLPFDDHARQIAGDHAETFLDSPIFRLEPSLVERINGLHFASEALRTSFLESERLGAFQSYALRTGSLAVNDIHTGEPAEYLGYFAQWDRYVYRFRGKTDFYLVAGGVAGFVRGVYLPDQEVFLYFDSIHAVDLGSWQLVKPGVASAILTAARRAGPAVPSPDPELGPRPRPRNRVVASIGGPENYAHVLWNSLGALERERGLGTLPRLRRLRSLASEYFGPLEELYPEIAGAEIKKLRHGGADRRNIDNGHQVLIPLGSVLIFPEGMARVAALADRHRADPELRPLMRSLKRYPTRIYVALRVGDKAWADAETELPKLINHVLSAYPDACFILDGFSVPSGVDHVTDRWQAQVGALDSLVATIRSRVEEPERVFDLMGLDLLKSIAVLRTASCYLSPIGTAHHKVDWMADIPGILYVSQDYARSLPFDAWAGLEQRLGSHTPRAVIGEDLGAESIRLRRSDDRRQGLSNFTLAWERVWGELEPILTEVSSGRPGRAAAVRRLLGRIGR